MHLIPAIQIVTVGLAHISLKVQKTVYPFLKNACIKAMVSNSVVIYSTSCHFKPVVFLQVNAEGDVKQNVHTAAYNESEL